MEEPQVSAVVDVCPATTTAPLRACHTNAESISKIVRNQFALRTAPQPCHDPPKSKWHDVQRQINEATKRIRENTAS